MNQLPQAKYQTDKLFGNSEILLSIKAISLSSGRLDSLSNVNNTGIKQQL